MAAFTNNIKINNVTLSSTEPRYSNESWTGAMITRSTGIQYYNIQFGLSFNQKDVAEYHAFVSQYSQGKPFAMALGHLSTYKGSQVGAVSATSPAAKGTYQVSTTANTLEIGTLIQFSNHRKIYRIIGRTGNTIQLFPNLRANVQTNETIRYTSIEGEFVLLPDNEYQLPISNVMSVQLTARENL